jgi:hypothetical protein
MLEPTLVRMEGRIDLQEMAHGGLFRAGKRLSGVVALRASP